MPRIAKPKLLQLQKKFKTDEAIGKKFGITRQAVHHMRKLYGIPPLPADNTKRDAAIIALSRKGMSGPAIADKIGLSTARVNNIIKKARAGKKKPSMKTPRKK